MNISFIGLGKGRELMQIDDARIIWKNFEGRGSRFNREGDRNFSIVIPDADMEYEGRMVPIVDVLRDHGYPVRVKPPREEGESPMMHLPVKVKLNEKGPKFYLETGNKQTTLFAGYASGHETNDDSTLMILDDMDILRCDMDIVPYDSIVNGQPWRTAYLRSIRVVQACDRFARRG